MEASASELSKSIIITFTCMAGRVRPKPVSMYFVFTDDTNTTLHGVRTTTQTREEDAVFEDKVVLEYNTLYTDATRTLRCILDMGPAGLVTKDYPLRTICEYRYLIVMP